MTTDSINDEMLRIKRELAGRFGNNLERIVADAKSRERNTINLPPRRCMSEQRDAPKPPNEADSNGQSPAAAG